MYLFGIIPVSRRSPDIFYLFGPWSFFSAQTTLKSLFGSQVARARNETKGIERHAMGTAGAHMPLAAAYDSDDELPLITIAQTAQQPRTPVSPAQQPRTPASPAPAETVVGHAEAERGRGAPRGRSGRRIGDTALPHCPSCGTKTKRHYPVYSMCSMHCMHVPARCTASRAVSLHVAVSLMY